MHNCIKRRLFASFNQIGVNCDLQRVEEELACRDAVSDASPKPFPYGSFSPGADKQDAFSARKLVTTCKLQDET
jgi:hypothetical protein